MDNENTNSAVQSIKRKRIKPPFIVGSLVIILAIVGLISLVGAGINGIQKLTDNTTKKDEYAKFLTPVVMFDPDPFDDISQAKMEQLINITIWSLVRSDEVTTNSYETTEDGHLSIPEKDVSLRFEKLFGNDVKISHRSVQGLEYEFAYDAELERYKVPITSVEPTYLVKVLDVNSKKNTIELIVAYIPSAEWAQNDDGAMIEPEADKYMKVTLRVRSDKTYYISALQQTEKPDYITTALTTTTTKATQSDESTSTSDVPTSETQEATSEETTGEKTEE